MAPQTPETPTESSTAPSQTEFVEYQGTTIFAADERVFRYSLTLKSNKLRVWLEDFVSKEQWCTTNLNLHDYVELANAIPEATATDYVECFHELLESPHDVNNIPSSFKRVADDAFELRMGLKVQVLNKFRLATYSFKLEPIPVEKIDVLQSKLRDLQEEIQILRVERQEAAIEQTTAISELRAEVEKLRLELDGQDNIIAGLENTVQALMVAIAPLHLDASGEQH